MTWASPSWSYRGNLKFLGLSWVGPLALAGGSKLFVGWSFPRQPLRLLDGFRSPLNGPRGSMVIGRAWTKALGVPDRARPGNRIERRQRATGFFPAPPQEKVLFRWTSSGRMAARPSLSELASGPLIDRDGSGASGCIVSGHCAATRWWSARMTASPSRKQSWTPNLPAGSESGLEGRLAPETPRVNSFALRFNVRRPLARRRQFFWRPYSMFYLPSREREWARGRPGFLKGAPQGSLPSGCLLKFLCPSWKRVGPAD